MISINFSTKFWFKMTKLMMNQFQKRNQFHIMNRFLQRNRFLLKTIPFAKGIDSFKKCQKWPKNRNRDSFGIGIDTALDWSAAPDAGFICGNLQLRSSTHSTVHTQTHRCHASRALSFFVAAIYRSCWPTVVRPSLPLILVWIYTHEIQYT